MESITQAKSKSTVVVFGHRMAMVLLFSVFLSGCGQLASFIRNLSPSANANRISGTVQAELLQKNAVAASAGSPSTAYCAEAKASLYEIRDNGEVRQPYVQSVDVAANGSFTFDKVEGATARGADVSSLRYLIEVAGCGSSYRRFVTGNTKQDVSFGSALLSFVLTTADARRVLEANPEDLDFLIKELQSYSDYSSAYAGLSANAQTRKRFEDVFGRSPEVLRDAAPTVIEFRAPNVYREGEAISLALSATQWRPGYAFAYLWTLDGVEIGASSNITHLIGKDAQGLHTLSVFYGQSDGNGGLDQSKPFGSKSLSIEIENNVPPQAPPLTVAGSGNVNSPSVQLEIVTGPGRVNCASFSKMALTENDPEPPSDPSAFSISCSGTPTQSLVRALSTSVGVKTLRLWARDSSGKVSATASEVSVTYSLVMPVVTLLAPAVGARSQGSISVSGTCESASGDVSLSGDVTPIVTACVGDAFTRSVQLVGADGPKLITASQTNVFGNTGSASVQVVKDTVGPSVLLSSSASSPTNLASIPVTVVFSEAVWGFNATKINAVNATVSGFAGSGAAYSFQLVPSGQGLVSASLASGAGTDQALNSSAPSNTLALAFDSIAPTVSVTSTAPNDTNASPIPFTITFNEAVTGLTLAGLSVTNGMATSLTGSGSSYDVMLTPSGQGNVTVQVVAGAAQDAAGNGNVASGTVSRRFDSVRPSVMLSSTSPDPTNQSPMPFSVSFSEAITGFTLAAVNVSNGTASSLTGSGANYSFQVTPSGNGSISVQIPNGVVQDAAGNTSMASATVTRVFNNVRPSVTLSSTLASPTN